MSSESVFVHLIAGGAGGTAGAVLTCPLEVVKTRLQSSVATFGTPPCQACDINRQNGGKGLQKTVQDSISRCNVSTLRQYSTNNTTTTSQPITVQASTRSPGLWTCLRYIVQNEGPQGLFKGLGPNLVGVMPSRAIYFCAYASAKRQLNATEKLFTPDTAQVHILSAAIAGFSASTATNPIWYIKTKLQLDQKKEGRLTVWKCIRDTYKERGIGGFYRGITASYYGIAETAIHFVIYEHIKSLLRERKRRNGHGDDVQSASDFLEYMGAGAISKTTATCIAYPHEVARTRLRQDGNIYRSFWQTLSLVKKQEGIPGLYRGLGTQLVRQIPNTAIMMSVYEAVVYMCSKYWFDKGEESHDY